MPNIANSEPRKVAVEPVVALTELGNLRANMNRLMETGCDPAKPVTVVSCTHQDILVGTVRTVADWVEFAEFSSPAIVVVGEIARWSQQLDRLLPDLHLPPCHGAQFQSAERNGSAESGEWFRSIH